MRRPKGRSCRGRRRSPERGWVNSTQWAPLQIFAERIRFAPCCVVVYARGSARPIVRGGAAIVLAMTAINLGLAAGGCLQRFPYVRLHRDLPERSTARIGRFVVPELPHHVSARARPRRPRRRAGRGRAAASALRRALRPRIAGPLRCANAAAASPGSPTAPTKACRAAESPSSGARRIPPPHGRASCRRRAPRRACASRRPA